MDKIIITIKKEATNYIAVSEEIPTLKITSDNISEIVTKIENLRKKEIVSRIEKEENYKDLEREIVFLIKITDFFKETTIINKTAFAKYVGINSSLFRQYCNGLNYMSGETLEKITNGLHKFGNEIKQIKLIK